MSKWIYSAGVSRKFLLKNTHKNTVGTGETKQTSWLFYNKYLSLIMLQVFLLVQRKFCSVPKWLKSLNQFTDFDLVQKQSGLPGSFQRGGPALMANFSWLVKLLVKQSCPPIKDFTVLARERVAVWRFFFSASAAAAEATYCFPLLLIRLVFLKCKQ